MLGPNRETRPHMSIVSINPALCQSQAWQSITNIWDETVRVFVGRKGNVLTFTRSHLDSSVDCFQILFLLIHSGKNS